MTADLDLSTPAKPAPRVRLHHKYILVGGALSIRTTTLMTTIPEKAPELFTYQAQTVKAEKEMGPGGGCHMTSSSGEKHLQRWT